MLILNLIQIHVKRSQLPVKLIKLCKGNRVPAFDRLFNTERQKPERHFTQINLKRNDSRDHAYNVTFKRYAKCRSVKWRYSKGNTSF